MSSHREEFIRGYSKLWRAIGKTLYQYTDDYVNYEDFEAAVMYSDMTLKEADLEQIDWEQFLTKLAMEIDDFMSSELYMTAHPDFKTIGDIYEFAYSALGARYQKKDTALWSFLQDCLAKYIDKETKIGGQYMRVQANELDWDTLLVYGAGLDSDALKAIEKDIKKNYQSQFRSKFSVPTRADVTFGDIYDAVLYARTEGDKHVAEAKAKAKLNIDEKTSETGKQSSDSGSGCGCSTIFFLAVVVVLLCLAFRWLMIGIQ